MIKQKWVRFLLSLWLLSLPAWKVVGAQHTVQAAPPPIYVDAAAAGLNNGSSWVNAYTSLQTALGAASSGGEIWVAQGIYKPGGSRSSTFSLKEGVTLYGGFRSGGGGGTMNDRDWAHYPTVLSGDIGALNVATDNCYHVLTSNGVSSAAVLDGFFIEDGYANGSSDNSRGGGMLNKNSSLALVRNTTFRDNYANQGGGMANTGASAVRLKSVVFERNKAGSSGGGMANVNSNVELDGVILRGNTTGTGTSDSDGGGMYNEGGAPELVNTLFVGNYATSDGGGMFNYISYPVMINVGFASNEAQGAGGGVYNFSGSLQVENSYLWDNAAPDGAQMKNSSSSVVIWYSAVQGGCPAGTSSCSLVSGGPSFVRDPDPGADGVWGSSDDDYGDLRYMDYEYTWSDHGNNAAIPAGVTEDIEGNPRIVRRYPTIATVDLGPYETPPDIIYVDELAPGANTGESWYDALTELQPALRWLRSGVAEVRVAQGVYKPGTARVNTFQLPNMAFVRGGFPPLGGLEIDPQRYPTILSGEIGDPGSWLDNSYHVVTISSNTDHGALLAGFVISGGAAMGDSCANDGCGGGVYTAGGDLYLRNTILHDNHASYGGGMANLAGGSVAITNVTFERNTALYDGGGLWNYASDIALHQVIFQGNLALGNGAGMDHNYGSPTLTNVVFVGNHASAAGGGLNSYKDGVQIVNSTFAENAADGGGSGLYLNDSDLEMDNSIVFSWEPDPITLVGGATANIAYSQLRSHCPNEPGWNCWHIYSGNPEFQDMPWSGLDGNWGTADDVYGNLRLTLFSPGVDAGDNAAFTNSIQIDMDGLKRFFDIASIPDSGSGTPPIVDMGAYEMHLAIYLPLVRR